MGHGTSLKTDSAGGMHTTCQARGRKGRATVEAPEPRFPQELPAKGHVLRSLDWAAVECETWAARPGVARRGRISGSGSGERPTSRPPAAYRSVLGRADPLLRVCGEGRSSGFANVAGKRSRLALDVLTCSVRAQKSRSPRSRSKGRREASYGAALCLCLLWRGVAREADVLCSVRGWSVPPALVTRTRIYQDLPHENTKQSLREATQRYTLVSRSVRWTAVTISKHPADMQLS